MVSRMTAGTWILKERYDDKEKATERFNQLVDEFVGNVENQPQKRLLTGLNKK
jgi:hypothetical protein